MNLYNDMAIPLGAAGRLIEANQHYESAIRYARKCGDLIMVCYCLNNMADNHIYEGYLDLAIQELSQALEITQRAGDIDYQVTLNGRMGLAYLEKGQAARALELTTLALYILNKQPFIWDAPLTYANHALAYAALGEIVKAREAAETSLKQCEDDIESKVYALLAMSKVQIAGHEYEAAETSLMEDPGSLCQPRLSIRCPR